ncbi:hypothetical protein [Pseudoteredinibacter isoporae]|uniref:hypothetical protein n=1 Tax=Pseudoteredinibacter isoporae TaxID=570281 RepID=UPI0033418B1C
MFHRALCLYFLVCAVIAVFILANAGSETPIIERLIYTFLYPLSGSIAAFYFWHRKVAGYLFGLLPCLSMVIRPIGEWAWISLPPPISLGFPMGDVAAGRGFIFDIWAALLSIRFIYGLYSNVTKQAAPESPD